MYCAVVAWYATAPATSGAPSAFWLVPTAVTLMDVAPAALIAIVFPNLSFRVRRKVIGVPTARAKTRRL
jgi:hypothetical protein